MICPDAPFWQLFLMVLGGVFLASLPLWFIKWSLTPRDRRRWHQYRLRVWQERLDLVNAAIPLLEKAELEYGSSTYTDKLLDAICRRLTAMSAVKYHSEKVGKIS